MDIESAKNLRKEVLIIHVFSNVYDKIACLHKVDKVVNSVIIQEKVRKLKMLNISIRILKDKRKLKHILPTSNMSKLKYSLNTLGCVHL